MFLKKVTGGKNGSSVQWLNNLDIQNTQRRRQVHQTAPECTTEMQNIWTDAEKNLHQQKLSGMEVGEPSLGPERRNRRFNEHAMQVWAKTTRTGGGLTCPSAASSEGAVWNGRREKEEEELDQKHLHPGGGGSDDGEKTSEFALASILTIWSEVLWSNFCEILSFNS